MQTTFRTEITEEFFENWYNNHLCLSNKKEFDLFNKSNDFQRIKNCKEVIINITKYNEYPFRHDTEMQITCMMGQKFDSFGIELYYVFEPYHGNFSEFEIEFLTYVFYKNIKENVNN